MTIKVNIAEAKAKLSELVARAEAGESVLLARNGKPVVRLALVSDATDEPAAPRKFGVWEHLDLDIDPDLFIGPDPETLAAADGPIFPAK